MRLLAIIGIVSLMLALAGCTAEKAATEQPAAGEAAEAVAESTAEQIESDLDTSSLDEIESDLDSMVLE